MQTALKSLSKQELIDLLKKQERLPSSDHELEALRKENVNLEQEIAYYKAQIEMYKRMQFGQKRERFEGDASQLPLPFETTAERELEHQEVVKKRSLTSAKNSPSTKAGLLCHPIFR